MKNRPLEAEIILDAIVEDRADIPIKPSTCTVVSKRIYIRCVKAMNFAATAGKQQAEAAFGQTILKVKRSHNGWSCA